MLSHNKESKQQLLFFRTQLIFHAQLLVSITKYQFYLVAYYWDRFAASRAYVLTYILTHTSITDFCSHFSIWRIASLISRTSELRCNRRNCVAALYTGCAMRIFVCEPPSWITDFSNTIRVNHWIPSLWKHEVSRDTLKINFIPWLYEGGKKSCPNER